MPGPADVLTVLLVGDDPLARSGLAALLAGEPGLAIVAQAAPADLSAGSDGDRMAGANAASGFPPRVALWDLGLAPGLALGRLADFASSGPPVLALLADEELAADAYAAGTRGLLFRDASPGRLAAALRALAGLLAPPSEDDGDPIDSAPSRVEPTEPLTPREIEVLQLLAEGLSNKRIAARLAISEHTAKFHVAAILGKLAAETRTDAVVRAARAGLILL